MHLQLGRTVSLRVAMDQYHYTEAKSDKLGEGTYGTVFKAVDRETGRRVAVKKAKLEVRGKSDCGG